MHYVYHPDYEPLIVSSDEYPRYLRDGWYDTPAKFPCTLEIKAEEKKEEIEGTEKTKEEIGDVKRKAGRPAKNRSPEDTEI